MKKNNILFLETGLGFGGAVTCLAALLKKLDTEKYNPVVISIHNDAQTKRIVEQAGAKFIHIGVYTRKKWVNNLLHRMARPGILKHIIFIFIFPVERILKFKFIIKIRQVIKLHDIKLVYLNNSLNDNEEAVIAAKLSNVPCIAHLRGPVYNSFVARFVSKYIAYFISVSDFAADSIKRMGIPSEIIKVVYDGIDLRDAEYRRNEPLKDNEQQLFNRYNVGLFGCLMEWKGHKVFIKAVDILVKEKKLANCKFFIVGDVPDQKSKYRQELANMVKDLKLSDVVIFSGYQNNVYKFMNKMDIVAHTSIEPEPLGTVIIEAMALGRPVIATKMGGPLEMIDDGSDGFLIPPADSRILAEKISHLLYNSDLRTKISKNAIQTANKKFNITEHVRQIQDACEKVLTNHQIK